MQPLSARHAACDILKIYATSYLRGPHIPYIAPFALFAVCAYIAHLFNTPQLLSYPIRTILVAANLIYFWNAYKQEIRFSFSWLAVISGVGVFWNETMRRQKHNIQWLWKRRKKCRLLYTDTSLYVFHLKYMMGRVRYFVSSAHILFEQP